MASAMDLFNTSLALAGVEIPRDRPLDGVDMSPILFGNGKGNRDVHFYYLGDQPFAVRKGAWKAHFITHESYTKNEPVKHDPPELYNVETDPSERFDVAAEHPDVVVELTKVYQNHLATITRGKLQF
jgi:arylsulfatase A-like enzyme